MASTVTLTCKQCGYVNEAERVYCHNCGTKLDRSILPKEEDIKKKEKPGHARRRIQRMANPGGGVVKREVMTFIRTMAYAVVVAALILAAREPAGIPPAKGELTATRFISSELMEAVESPQPRGLAFTEAEVNGYLKQAIKSKKGSGMIPGIEYERSFVDFEPGTVRIFSEQSLWGYSLYSNVLYRLEVKNGNFTPTLLGGGFGRLAVHPLIMQYGDYIFQKLWGALKREHQSMKSMREVRCEKDRIVLYTRGGAAR